MRCETEQAVESVVGMSIEEIRAMPVDEPRIPGSKFYSMYGPVDTRIGRLGHDVSGMGSATQEEIERDFDNAIYGSRVIGRIRKYFSRFKSNSIT